MNLSIKPVMFKNYVNFKTKKSGSLDNTKIKNAAISNVPNMTTRNFPFTASFAFSYSDEAHTFFPKAPKNNENKPETLEITDPVKWAQTWNYNTRKAYYDGLYQEEIKHKLTKIGNKKIKARYDLQFSQEQTKVMNILQGVKAVQDKLDSAEAKEKAIAKITQEVQTTQEIKERINSRLNNPNANINQTIAGYDYQKDLVRDEFLAPIETEKVYIEKYNEMLNNKSNYTEEEIAEAKKKAENVSIPPSILFYGCFGTGKTTFSKAIAIESGCFLEIYSPANEPYEKFISRVLEESKDRYLETRQRTVAIINEVEKYLNNSYVFCNSSGKEEKAKLAITKERVSSMRDTLDNCSKLPKDGNYGAAALSFFFTTNYPKDLTEIGLIGRDGRMPLVIPVEPATDEDLKEVLKFHIKRVMPKENGFDIDKYDFSKIVEKLKLSDEKGCYSNDRLRAALDEIRTTYDRNPNQNFAAHLEDMILNNKCRKLKMRDITPKLYEQYYNDFETIGEG